MKFQSNPIAVNATTIDTGLWDIQRYGMQHYGVDEAARDISPLKWYINTGRASLEFTRKLHEGGSYDEAIQRIKDYIGFKAD